MRLTNKELIDEFYVRIQEQYPHLSQEQVRDIVFGPWRYLKQGMESGDLPEMRMKYFGVFQVYKGRAVNMLASLEERFKEGQVDTLTYQRLTTMLKKYLKRLTDEA